MLEEEVRLKENCTQMERQINDLGVGYKFNKYLKGCIVLQDRSQLENSR